MSDMHAWSDERLIEYYYDHPADPTSITLLVERHEDRLWTFLKHRCRSDADAKEVAQDTWVRLIDGKAIYRGDNNASFRAFLYGVALRICRERYRDRWLYLVKSADAHGDEEHDPIAEAVDPSASLEERLDEGRRKLLVRDAVRRLSPRQREAVILHFFCGMARHEIAEAMGIGEESVRTHLAEAYRKLRQWLPGVLRHG